MLIYNSLHKLKPFNETTSLLMFRSVTTLLSKVLHPTILTYTNKAILELLILERIFSKLNVKSKLRIRNALVFFKGIEESRIPSSPRWSTYARVSHLSPP